MYPIVRPFKCTRLFAQTSLFAFLFPRLLFRFLLHFVYTALHEPGHFTISRTCEHVPFSLTLFREVSRVGATSMREALQGLASAADSVRTPSFTKLMPFVGCKQLASCMLYNFVSLVLVYFHARLSSTHASRSVARRHQITQYSSSLNLSK
jgi:hypothetical protein